MNYPDDRSELLGVFNLNKAHANDHALVLSAVLSHNQLERKVALVLNTLDLLSSFTTMDESIRASVKALAELSSTKHQLVQRKAKQIAQMARDNVAESHKEVVLPELKRIASGMLSEQEEGEALANVKVRTTRTVARPLRMTSVMNTFGIHRSGDPGRISRREAAAAAHLTP